MDKRRVYERVPILAEVTIYIDEGAELDVNKQPCLHAKAYDISLGGIAMKCDTFIAYSESTKQEATLKRDMVIYLVSANYSEPFKAKIAWLSGNNFGCQFIDLKQNMRGEIAKKIRELEAPDEQKENIMNDISIKCSHCGNEILIANIKINFDVLKGNK